MAAKRKAMSPVDGATKKICQATPSPSTEPLAEPAANDATDHQVDSTPESPDDRVVNYLDNGKKRAESEAKRAWSYVCEFQGCGQRFNRPCRLEAHMRTHNKERPFVCTHEGCDKTFPRKDHLQRHIKNAHAETGRDFTCRWEGCGKSFTSNGRLQRHQEVHESKFYCTGYPPCKEAFRKQKTLDAHIQNVHLQAKAFPCTFVDPETGDRCLNSYKTEHALLRHNRQAHGGQENKNFCMLCPLPGTECDPTINADGDVILVPREPLSFPTPNELHAHHRVFHKPTCHVCGQVFNQRSTLESHYQALHVAPSDQQLFQCPYEDCGRIFNRNSNLTVHVTQVHEGQKQYACTPEVMLHSKHPDLSGWNGENACNKLFKAKSSLEQHIRTHHLGLRNRKATRQLAKARKKLIPNPSALTLLTGVGYEDGRPIACLLDDCPHRFARTIDLKRHMLAEHNGTEADVEAGILERDARNGAQFWIGGLDDYEASSTSSSNDPSLPHTPLSYPDASAMHLNLEDGGFPKTNEPFDFEEPRMDAAMLNFETGLNDFSDQDPANGSQLGMLAHIQQYNAQM